MPKRVPKNEGYGTQANRIKEEDTGPAKRQVVDSFWGGILCTACGWQSAQPVAQLSARLLGREYRDHELCPCEACYWSLGNFPLLPLNEDDRGLPRDLITDSMKSKSRVTANTFKIFF